MRQRTEHILEDTTITLADGTQFRTRYERERHTVTCGLCLINIPLPVTANPYALESHRKACRHRQGKQAAKKFQVLDVVPEAEGSFNLQLLFRTSYDPEDTDLLMLPDILMSMQVKMRTSRAEETAHGIKEQLTMQARADFKLLNSNDLPLDISEHCTESIETYDKIGGFIGKWQKAETQSILKPPYKKHHF